MKRKGKLNDFGAVLKEYVDLQHAEKVPRKDLYLDNVYYLPVHGVFKDSSTTTKCRAVFDASANTTSGFSLNDQLLPGPNLYPLLSDILIRFRSRAVAISADISKMFREIWLHPEERDWHSFVIQDSRGSLVEHRMTRLTFGVKSSPFLVTQVLRRLAHNCQEDYPEAAQAIRTCFYVDDYLSGAETVVKADFLRRQLSELLNNAGMTLRKWRSNSHTFMDNISEELRETDDLSIASPSSMKKAFGIHWDSHRDKLHVSTLSL